ncbi:casein kinase II subunit alpha'-interacting protein [Acomys russatus]|uniref:casein kinase II subunit alpha'-interacting protein n=1 Tax=Acomys russatus TaxID=60746 RepID=UPI0021E21A36|nr:casein kinase II subunit alpha'-interacting protein [Acomys russatus]
MVPLDYHDQNVLQFDNSQQQDTNNSPIHQYTGDKVNQPNNQLMSKEQSQSTVTVNSSSFHNKAQSCSTLSTPKSKVIQGSYNRAMKSSSLNSKYPATYSKDLQLKTSVHPSWESLDISLSHDKPQTTSSSKFANTSSLEPSQIASTSRLPLPKPQTSSNIDVWWKSPLLGFTQKLSTSTSSSLPHQETPVNMIWTLPSLENSPSEPKSTLCNSKSQKESSLDNLWSSLLESNKKALSSPPLNNKPQRNDFLPTSSPLEFNRMGQNSPLSDCKPLKVPVSNSNNNFLSLPLSQAKSRKSPLLSNSVLPSQSFPTCQPKPKTVVRCGHSSRVVSSSVCHSKAQNSTSVNDKHRAHRLPSAHPKPTVSGKKASSPKPYVKNKSASVLSSKPQSKDSPEESVKPEPENESPWSLYYSHPCIIKGGTVPVDVVNKIINSISKSTIQKDLSRQILFRRMRGRPNPRPGPRLSSTYTVCLECASYIKSQCSHLTGKKDPRCATLFVIPTPENSSDGKVDLKLVLILSLPETSSSSCLQLSMKDSQADNHLEALDNNLEDLETITQFFSASESDFIQELNSKGKWLAASSENKDLSPKPQAVDWLLYVKNSNNTQPQGQVPAPSCSSSSSSSSSSCSISSSSSSSTGLSTTGSPYKGPTPTPLSGYTLSKVRSYHRLPPGVSWLEFIRGSSSEATKTRQSASPKTKHVRTRNTKSMKKGRKGPNTLLRYFQTKFQNEKS